MPSGGWGRTVPLVDPSTHSCQIGTLDIAFLLAPVPLFRVVDANSRNLPYILYHNTFFHVLSAENQPPTAAGASVRAKEFLYTTPRAYRCQVQSETHGDDTIHSHSRSIHKRAHVLDHGEESLHQFDDVEGIDSETKW